MNNTSTELNMEIEAAIDTSGLKQIRRRRQYFWATVILYMPLMLVANQISPTLRCMAITFCVWVLLLFAVTMYLALARCPVCGQYFHLRGMSFLPVRRCMHCQLHINDDKAK